jgi:hypothetical protein
MGARLIGVAAAVCLVLGIAGPIGALAASEIPARGRAPVWMSVTPQVVQPGQKVRAKLRNESSHYVAFGIAFKVEEMVEGQWVKASFFRHGVWTEQLLAMGPGGVFPIRRVHIPIDADPGRYRVSKVVEDERHAWRVSGEFRVAG